MATTAKKPKERAAVSSKETSEAEQQLRKQLREQEPKPPPRDSLSTTTTPQPLPDSARLRHLIAAFAPVLRLHPDDAYRPCSAEWFARRSSLWWDGDEGAGGDSPRCLAALGECTFALALEKQRELGRGVDGAGRRLRLSLDPLARGGQALEELDERVPLYVRAHLAIPPPTMSRERQQPVRPRLEITYLALYAYNGPYHVLGAMGPGLGAHDGDLERLTVRLDPETGEMVGCFFSAHRPRDGGWAPASDVERYEEPSTGRLSCSSPAAPSAAAPSPAAPSLPRPFSAEGRIVAYVARHGHGTYPTRGTHLRAGFFANDNTSSRGKAWAPKRMVLLRASGTRANEGAPPSPSPPSPPPKERDPSPVAALLESPELGVTVCRGCELEAPSRDSSSRPAMPPPTDPARTGVVVESDSCPGFSDFEGKFGEVLAARSQGWWARAECPVSRGTALRVVGHFFGEKESLY